MPWPQNQSRAGGDRPSLLLPAVAVAVASESLVRSHDVHTLPCVVRASTERLTCNCLARSFDFFCDLAVRVRPFNGRERRRRSPCVISMDGATTTLTMKRSGGAPPQVHTFTYDYSFWSHEQGDSFASQVRPAQRSTRWRLVH